MPVPLREGWTVDDELAELFVRRHHLQHLVAQRHKILLDRREPAKVVAPDTELWRRFSKIIGLPVERRQGVKEPRVV